MATPKVINKQLDLAVLNQMEEPISVSVSRQIGGQYTPIPLPPKPHDGGGEWAPGEGWEKREISKLEGWLVSDFTGGGMYVIKLVDAKNLAFEWKPYFDPRQYPMRNPPTISPPNVPITNPPAGITLVQTPDGAIEEWPPRGMISNMLNAPTPQPVSSQVPSMSFPQFSYPWGRPPPVEEERRRHEEQERQHRDQIARLEREALEAKHKADLERIKLDNDRKLDEIKASLAPKTDEATTRRLDKLEGLIERLVDRVSTPVATGPSPELVALQEQNRKLEERLEREAAERRHAEQMAALERRIDAAAAKPSGPDPTFLMLVDAMKHSQNDMQRVIDSMGKQMLTPQDVLNLARQTNSGIDDLRANVVNTFSQMFELQKRAFENAANFLPQGDHPAVRVIEGVTERVGEVVGKWAESKDAAQVAQAKAVAAQAQAQKAAIDAQRESLSQMAAQQAAMEARAVANAAHVGREQPGLAGAAPTQPADGGRVIPLRPNASEARPSDVRLGKTDEQWFGGALTHVNQLRDGVAIYLSDPKSEAGISPEKAAEFLQTASATILQQGLRVIAFDELFMVDGRLEDFMMVLLPGAPPEYRIQVLDILAPEDDEDDDDEDAGEEPAKVETKVETPSTQRQTQPLRPSSKAPKAPTTPRA